METAIFVRQPSQKDEQAGDLLKSIFDTYTPQKQKDFAVFLKLHAVLPTGGIRGHLYCSLNLVWETLLWVCYQERWDIPPFFRDKIANKGQEAPVLRQVIASIPTIAPADQEAIIYETMGVIQNLEQRAVYCLALMLCHKEDKPLDRWLSCVETELWTRFPNLCCTAFARMPGAALQWVPAEEMRTNFLKIEAYLITALTKEPKYIQSVPMDLAQKKYVG